MRRLPYLNGVRAFEAAARHGSFKGAGKELNVTPAAVSRMVRLLEERAGLALFDRKANRLELTHAGEAYRNGLTTILDSLAALTSQVQAIGATNVLTVGVGPTFATRWLIPRLPDFQAFAPDVELRLATGGAVAPFADDWSCGIAQGEDYPDGLKSEPMISASLTPVCAPALASKLKHPKDLADVSMIRVSHSPQDWQKWLKLAGLPRVRPHGTEFEYYAQVLQAAGDGLGVAMGIRLYVDDDIRAGRLVTPFPEIVRKRCAHPIFSSLTWWRLMILLNGGSLNAGYGTQRQG